MQKGAFVRTHHATKRVEQRLCCLRLQREVGVPRRTLASRRTRKPGHEGVELRDPLVRASSSWTSASAQYHALTSSTFRSGHTPIQFCGASSRPQPMHRQAVVVSAIGSAFISVQKRKSRLCECGTPIGVGGQCRRRGKKTTLASEDVCEWRDGTNSRRLSN